MIVVGIESSGEQPDILFTFDDEIVAGEFIEKYNASVNSHRVKKTELYEKHNQFRSDWIMNKALEKANSEKFDFVAANQKLEEMTNLNILNCKQMKNHNYPGSVALRDQIKQLKMLISEKQVSESIMMDSLVYDISKEFNSDIFLNTLCEEDVKIFKSNYKYNITVLTSDAVHNPMIENYL